MAKLKIYGVPRSRAFRTLWLAHELGLDYENIPVNTSGESREASFLAINPNGHIPAIDDDGFILWESMAIDLYLAKKHGLGRLYPTTLQGEALAWQWSFWGITEVERPVLTAMFNRALLPEDKRDAAAADAAEKEMQSPLGVLDGALAKRPYLIGNDFTVADLNVAAILAWARPARIDMTPFPKVADWLGRCALRPAAKAARDMQR
ncbi:MAG: glutathione S-transferase family protein [Stellaceae bacterium]